MFTVHADRCTGSDLLHPPRRHEVHARAHEDPESDQEQESRGEVHVGKASGARRYLSALQAAGFMSRVSSPVVTDLVVGMKRALDPQNVLGARNSLLAAETP